MGAHGGDHDQQQAEKDGPHRKAVGPEGGPMVGKAGRSPRRDSTFPRKVALGAPTLDRDGAPAWQRRSLGGTRRGPDGRRRTRTGRRAGRRACGRSWRASGTRRATVRARRVLLETFLPDLLFDPDRVRSYRCPGQLVLFLSLTGLAVGLAPKEVALRAESASGRDSPQIWVPRFRLQKRLWEFSCRP